MTFYAFSICWSRRHGKLLEEGASGFLQKKVFDETSETVKEETVVDWELFNKMFHDGGDADASFGSKKWASVYLASTPQQAASMGLEFPGVNEVTNMCFSCTWCFFMLTIYVKGIEWKEGIMI